MSNRCGQKTTGRLRSYEQLPGKESTMLMDKNVCVPFWNPLCQEISSQLYLPTVIDSPVFGLTSSSGLSSGAVGNSWFSKNFLSHPIKNSFKISIQSCESPPTGCTNLEITKSKLVRLSPTKVRFDHSYTGMQLT